MCSSDLFPSHDTKAQNNKTTATITHERDSNLFYHTIQRGETVYSIATMYGVKVNDIYKLNPESKEGIKVGFKLMIPQLTPEATGKSNGAANYLFHTIKAKETLYSVSRLYTVPATLRNIKKIPFSTQWSSEGYSSSSLPTPHCQHHLS